MVKRRKKAKRGTGRNIGKNRGSTGAADIESTGATGEQSATEGEPESADGVGVLSSMSGNNKVEVDQAALAAEADAIAEEFAPRSPPVGAPAINVEDSGVVVGDTQANDSWVMMCNGVVPVLSITLLPQWNITKEEQAEMATSLGVCLDQVFPGGMDGKYACWARLAFCMGGIAVTRAMSNGGKLPGFGPRVEKKIVDKKDDAKPVAPVAAVKELSDAEKFEAALQGT